MSDGALDDYVSAWREADPQRTYGWLFLDRSERIRYGACAALVHEWRKTVREVREPQVAMAKLGWWREELQRAVEGAPRHPLTQSLFADAQARTVPLSCWTAVVDAALLLVGAAPSADFAAQRRAIAPLSAAIAELETRLWFGPSADVARAAAVTGIACLAGGLRALPGEVERGRSPLPMNLLARHGLTIGELAGQDPGRRAALRDYAQLLRGALVEAATMTGPLTLFRAIALQHDLRNLEYAASAEEPLAALHPRRPGIGDLLKSWREARTWRAVSHREANA
ncbi:MAG TPA: squalene/phytoene synthase family protein [Rhodanobacteraceae bacterium]|nr:squalene/phytoene synthase family protein [Rhodanobacteraceae bacterium]